jgi:phosphatidylethanolamine-binding protein (PEBP) family uncharacterized protein
MSFFLAAAIAGYASAQTPPNAPSFIPAETNHLKVDFGTGDVVAGTQFPVTFVAKMPTIAPSTQLNGTFTLIMVDPDAPKATGGSQTILHWM